MASPPSWGFLLRNGSRIVHGSGVNVRSAFPPELNIPGTLHLFSPGHAADPATPTFRGAMGYFPFDTSMRMPRHVHVSTGQGPKRFIVEKVLTLTGIGLAELAGEVYVVPPLTMVLIAPGVPHTWTACPAGLDLQALGISDEKLVSDGKFSAMFEYDDATTFYPTRQTERLANPDEYVKCEDLQGIRFPKMEVQDVIEKAWFIWNMSARKLDGTTQ
ncbi:Leucine-tRNA ligase [Pleurostoma richardsiae]|jgi:quercetin dioxygenase-like cupin family protein|uniref:Leucine-tRNA ligase n=1 Tax=Pleurostoma richardsiae TaxID=41990 RepID=A0AA38RDT7_9PEZI|nr:Leucine-tRNA ligase [Pleurostoma richardsiae]